MDLTIALFFAGVLLGFLLGILAKPFKDQVKRTANNYIDWSKVPMEYNYVNIYKNDPCPISGFQFWKCKPELLETLFSSSTEIFRSLGEIGGDMTWIVGQLPTWRESLQERPK